MADETLTGAKTEVAVDNTAEDKKKKIIKIVIIIVVIVVAYFLVRKFIFKK